MEVIEISVEIADICLHYWIIVEIGKIIAEFSKKFLNFLKYDESAELICVDV